MRKAIRICLFLSLFAIFACTKTYQSQDPKGLVFPKVQATSLTKKEVIIPDFFKGKPILLLVGYIQDSQFDIDRWILGLKQLKTPIEIAEIPTIQGFFPRMIQGTIDDGMRSGIPEEDWKIVFTVYQDAEKIIKFLGNTRPLNARIVLIDESGVVDWFYDKGFSSDRAIELDGFIRKKYKN